MQGSLGGEYVRESLNLTVWGAAQERIRGWEASGQIGVVRSEVPTIKEAVAKHIADAEGWNLQAESVKKIKDVIERKFLDYCTHEGYRSLRQLDVDAAREFRNRLVKDYTYSKESGRPAFDDRGFVVGAASDSIRASNPPGNSSDQTAESTTTDSDEDPPDQ